MNIIDRVRLSLARPLLQKMARQLLPVISPWVSATFFDIDFTTLRDEGYKKNSAFFACLSALSFAFIEPSLKVYDAEKQEILKHPTRKLILRPNDLMGEQELLFHTIVYMGIGGNAFWYKLRNNQGQVIGLIPYHIGNILPVPNSESVPDKDGRISWILRYDYDDGTGQKLPISKENIVHFKWPLPDVGQAWLAQAPILSAAREVDTDNEATRYLKAILQNDAIPRVVMYVPAESNLDLDDPEKINRFKSQFRQKYGGDNRGDLAIITGGAKLERISLNLEELAFEALHRIPETRIAAALRVPPIVAGLNTGLERSTYSNYGEAVEHFTRGTLAPLWRLVASEIDADTDLNPNGDMVRFDLSEVQALQEDATAKWARLQAAFNSGAITVNDFLAGISLPALMTGGDVRLMDSGKVLVDLATNTFTPVSAPPPPPMLPAPVDEVPDDEPPADDEEEPVIEDDEDEKRAVVHLHKNGKE